jgi:hypothetical protein
MIFTLDKRGKAHPPKLPCGCSTIGNLKAVGPSGEPIQGLTGVNSKTGWMRVQRCVVYPNKMKTDPRTGRSVTTQAGISQIQVTGIFELRCKTHGKLAEEETP